MLLGYGGLLLEKALACFGDLDLKFSGKLRNSCPNSYAKKRRRGAPPFFRYREKTQGGMFKHPPFGCGLNSAMIAPTRSQASPSGRSHSEGNHKNFKTKPPKFENLQICIGQRSKPPKIRDMV